MLEGLKEKVFGRKKHDIDYSDVRSHVVGERAFEPQTIGEKFGFEKPDFPQDPYVPESFQPQPFTPQQFSSPPQHKFGSRPDPRMDFGMEEQQPRARDYDILDRLNLIESQLSAIRSQTETINERLKNMETRLSGRRF
ncbi:MAG: hypothetical protein HY514_02620 [Candidatus Aenigmarchaeota archaeon]|nr:hypothetical protein [Candidatus Aenigmarchaeota archaeon]